MTTEASPGVDLLAWLRRELPSASIARAEAGTDEDNHLVVVIHTARPGIVIGKQAKTLASLQERLADALEPIRAQLGLGPLRLNIIEIRRPELEPLLVAETLIARIAAGVEPQPMLERLAQQSIRAGAKRVRLSVTGAIEAEASEGEGEGESERASLEGETALGAIGCAVELLR